MVPKNKAKKARKAKGKQQPAAKPSAPQPADPKPPPKKRPVKRAVGGMVHAGPHVDLDVEVFVKGMLHEGETTPDEW